MKKQFLSLAPKNTQHNLNVERVGSEFITIPNTDEQAAILSYVDQMVVNLRDIKSILNQDLEKLKLLKSSIISNAVTGNLKLNTNP